MPEQNKSTNTEFCSWLGEEYYDVWHTSCNNAWQFMEGGPRENHVKFCPFCGKQIVVVKMYELEKDEDGRTTEN